MRMNPRSKTLRLILLKAIVLCLLFPALQAQAICLFLNGATKKSVTVTPTNITRSPAENGVESLTYTISSSELASAWGVNTGTAFLACSTDETLSIGHSSFSPVGAGSNDLATNIEGVTFSAGTQAGTWTYPNNGGNATLSLSSTSISANTLVSGSQTVAGSMVIVQKTQGMLRQGGTVNGGKLFSIITSTGLEVLDVDIASFTVTVPTCTVNSYDASVDLGTTYTQKLKTVGTTSSAAPFTINMTCANETLSPTITFSADTDASNTTVIKNKGTATGVGIQLGYENEPVVLNEATSLGGGVTTVAKNYDFTARLYQLEDNVGPGSIDASATFTIDYE